VLDILQFIFHARFLKKLTCAKKLGTDMDFCNLSYSQTFHALNFSRSTTWVYSCTTPAHGRAV